MSVMVEMGDVIKAIQDAVGAVTGIRNAPDGVPDKVDPLPAAICYPKSGYFNGPILYEGEHNIVVEIHLAKTTDLARDTIAAYPYWKAIPAAIMADPDLGGKIEYPRRISYTFGQMDYNGISTIGWRFTLENVKIFKFKK